MTVTDYLKQIDDVIAAGPYKDSWESLAGKKTPDWYYKGKFGIFVHWGIYAQLEDHEQAFARRDMDRAEYESLASTFNPPFPDPQSRYEN